MCLYASTSTTLTSLIMGKEKRTLHRVANATTAPSCFVSSNARKWVYRGVIRERYRLIFLRRGSVPKDKTLLGVIDPLNGPDRKKIAPTISCEGVVAKFQIGEHLWSDETPAIS